MNDDDFRHLVDADDDTWKALVTIVLILVVPIAIALLVF